ncbi:MAG: YkgJ family cysteine cluster protein [Tenuifilaceae bacterium]
MRNNKTVVRLPVIDNCDGCGACCMEMRTPPFYPSPEDARWAALPAEMQQAICHHALSPLSEVPDASPCLWFDDERNQCRHYDLRPDICREFERGSASCHMWRHNTFVSLLTPEQWCAVQRDL